MDFEDEHQRNSARANGYLVWSCDSNLSDSTCIGIQQYAEGSLFTLLDLSTSIYNTISGFAVDGSRQMGYLLTGNSLQNLSCITVDLTTGQFFPSSGQLGLKNTDKVLDMAYDSSSRTLYALLQHNYGLPSENTLEVIQIDPKSAKYASLITVATEFWIYFSSTYDENGNYFAILANQSGWQLFTFNLKKISVVQESVTNGFVSVVFNSAQMLLGNFLRTYNNGTNSLVLLNTQNGSMTFQGQPIVGMYCGAQVPHGGLDTASNVYYTMCCYDLSGCTNATLVEISVPTNTILRNTLLPFVSEVQYGLFWVPTSNSKIV
jgi:hypothetical protein